jgi:hypothetical protein
MELHHLTEYLSAKCRVCFLTGPKHEAMQVSRLCAGGDGDAGEARWVVVYRIGKLESHRQIHCAR